MNPEIKTKWLAALRSGEYLQGQCSLKSVEEDDENSFCCLGVLCDIYSQEKDIPWTPMKDCSTILAIHGNTNWLPIEVSNWAGLKGINPEVKYKGALTPLSHLNDNEELSFKEIATLIEAHL